jgi:CrcB protein
MSGLAIALLVGVGGVFGAVTRYGVDARLPGSTATLVVNVLGSVAVGALGAADLPAETIAIAAMGFCGAFTTFSSFAVEVADRLEQGDHAVAARYGGATLALALFGVAVGTIVVNGLA